MLGAAAKVALELAIVERTARPLLTLPHIGTALGVVTAAHGLIPSHLAHVDQRLTPLGLRAPVFMAAGLLSEVGEHGRQGLAADGVSIAAVAVVAAQGRELGRRLQQATIGVLGGA